VGSPSAAAYAQLAGEHSGPRNHVRRVLKKNPALRLAVEEAVSEAYADARIRSGAQTRLDERGLPARCPYSWPQIKWTAPSNGHRPVTPI